jgi:rhizosphere induced protein
MPTYTVNFTNNTDQTWTMVLYQKLPNGQDLDSVSWLQTTAPPGGTSGVQFRDELEVALAYYSENGGRGIFHTSQILPAGYGSAWRVVFEDGVQQLKNRGRAALPQQITITNESASAVSAGIGMSEHAAVYRRNLATGATAQFQVTPSYFVGLFDNVVRGEVITDNVGVGPEQLRFPPGSSRATVTANLDDSQVVLRIQYE